MAEAHRACVDLTAPTVSVQFPTANLTLDDSQDRDPRTPDVMDIQVTGTTGGTATAGCNPARSAEKVEIRVNDALQDSFAPTANGAFARDVHLPAGANTVQVCAFDVVGNSTCSAKIPLTVSFATGAALRVQTPVADARLLHAADIDASTDAYELDVVVAATNIPAGTTVSVEIDGGRWVCTGQVQQSGNNLAGMADSGTGGFVAS